jgi:hypothetical protein
LELLINAEEQGVVEGFKNGRVHVMCRHMMEWLLVSIHVKQTLRLVHPSQFLIYWFMGTYGYLALHYFRKKGNHHFMNLASLMQLCPFHVLGLPICGF